MKIIPRKDCSTLIILYYGSGARDFELLGKKLSSDEWLKLKSSTCRLLRARKFEKAAQILESSQYELYEATNVFGDDFSVLYELLPIEKYVEKEENLDSLKQRDIYKLIANTISEIGPYIRFIAIEISDNSKIEPVENPKPKVNSEVVIRALSDAQHLLDTSGAISAVDRVHTAIHGYIKSICDENGIKYKKDESITTLYKLLRENNPELKSLSSNSQELDRIVKALATILDSINTIRNHYSVAHPNENLLNEDEAILVINSVRTILHFLDSIIKK